MKDLNHLGAKLITPIMDIFLSLWNDRNKILHGEDPEAEEQKLLDRVALRIDKYWHRRHKLTPHDRQRLFQPLPDQLKLRPRHAQERWLEFAEIFFPQALKRKALVTQGQSLMTHYISPG